jgi:hypothetical protein
VHEVAATGATAIVIVVGDNLTVAAVIWIAPAYGTTGRAALPGVHLRLLRKLTVSLIEGTADLAANNTADDGSGHGGYGLARSSSELIADHASGNGPDHRTGVLLGLAGSDRQRERHDQGRDQHRVSHEASLSTPAVVCDAPGRRTHALIPAKLRPKLRPVARPPHVANGSVSRAQSPPYSDRSKTSFP